MAKAKKKSHAKKKTARPPADENVLAVVTAVRWYVNTIENTSLQTYLGNHQHWKRVQAILSTAVRDLTNIRTPRALAMTVGGHPNLQSRVAFEDDCPAPWRTCSDGSCQPDCIREFEK